MAGVLMLDRERRPISSNNPGCGKPAKGNLCDLFELAAVAFSFICSAAALGTVFVDSNAAYLGGVNQLIVLGALLTRHTHEPLHGKTGGQFHLGGTAFDLARPSVSPRHLLEGEVLVVMRVV